MAFPEERDSLTGLKEAGHHEFYSWQEVNFANNHICLEVDPKTQMGPQP